MTTTDRPLAYGEPLRPTDVTRRAIVDARRHDAALFDLDGLVTGTAPDEATALVRRLEAAGIATAAYSSSVNTHAALQDSGLAGLFRVRVDSGVAEGRPLLSDPDPTLLLDSAARLGVRPDRCVVFDHSRAGMTAARTGGFGMVVGVGSHEHLVDLLACGADAAVTDLTHVEVVRGHRRMSSLPQALASVEMLGTVVTARTPAVFVDFDGTLSDIVGKPAAATILPAARDALAALATFCPVAVLSGRNADDVSERVDVPGLWYAGNHGLELISPDGIRHDDDAALAARPALQRAAETLHDALSGVDGVEFEHKRHAIAVHYRRVDATMVARVTAAAHTVGRRENLRVMHGRKVIELHPDIDCDKGAALRRITGLLGFTDPVPVYLGDDLTDEDAFDAVERDGIGILVRHDEDGDRPTSARFAVDSPRHAAALLAEIASRLAVDRRESVDRWAVTFDGYDPGTELRREVLCSTGNGFLGVRGCAPESRSGEVHYPGTYRVGLYDRLTDRIAGHCIDNESVVNLPNWLPLTFGIDDGPWFDLDDGTHRMLSYRQTIDVRRAELQREFRIQDDQGRITSVIQRRFTSMREPNLCGMQTTVSTDNWSGTIRFRSAIDGDVANRGVGRYRELSGQHLSRPAFSAEGCNTVICEVQTVQSRIRIAVAARTIAYCDGPASVEHHTFSEGAEAGHVASIAISAGQSVTVEKMVVVFTGSDHAISEPGDAARKQIRRVGRYATHMQDHAVEWAHLWEGFHLDLEDDQALRVIRLHTYHLLQCLSPHTADCDAGMPARGLHGEAYRGHVFWDDLFVLPVLNLHLPNVTHSILRYRYRRLAEACHAASAAGYSGAMFPWQSGSDGREESQKLHLNPRSGRWNPDPSALANHVGIAVAYEVWQYYQVTGDLEFLTSTGAEVLVQIARFWVSKARFDSARDRYVIEGVIGPDEFHTGYPGRRHRGVDNNAYTNVMAVWVILRARDALDALPLPDRLDLVQTLHLHGTELALWDRVSRRMFVPFHDGVISQFEGYEELRELDWPRYRERYGDIGRMDRILEAEGDDVNDYRVVKQADAVMLFYLLSADEIRQLLGRLGYAFGPEQVPQTIDYYLSRTTHGSTLSAVVYSWVLARGNRTQATDYFQKVLASDVADADGGTTTEGVHLAAMAGSIDLLQRCYAGLETRDDRLVLGPMWPEDSGTLGFSIQYRGHRLHLRIAGRTASVIADPSEAAPIVVECRGRTQLLRAGETISVG
ncbi:trehalose-phosphatase [Mycolicibacterium sp. P9-64]|uniref:trehalose-phosphatase n=1 Tax=Mycolicibacterium sp. P9-64 TaxID=2024612 RepID=UPI0011EC3D3B|nr:trehalose-phosphatase [Mycolicibacterium sp. P9-64]KAA0079361.1 trehalose-phosphatase [Mycolicibacterium sp. P9-64]